MKTTFVAAFVGALSLAAAQGVPGVLIPTSGTLIFEPIPTGSASSPPAYSSAPAVGPGAGGYNTPPAYSSGVAKPTGKPIGTGGYASPTGGSSSSNGTVPKPSNSVVPYTANGAEKVMAGGSLVAAVAAAVFLL